MTKEEYLEHHIPHRINLLITFRERYGGLDNQTRDKVVELSRDFHRCSKDISMMMVRFLLEELGIKLPRKNEKRIDAIVELKPYRYAKPLHLRNITENDQNTIFEVLKAANRAVAHIEESDVNHELKDQTLFDVINYTEQMCIKHLYEHNKCDYHLIMKQPNNQMHQERLDLVGLAKSR